MKKFKFFGIDLPFDSNLALDQQRNLVVKLFGSSYTSASEAGMMINNIKLLNKAKLMIEKLELEFDEERPCFILKEEFNRIDFKQKINEWLKIFGSLPTEDDIESSRCYVSPEFYRKLIKNWYTINPANENRAIVIRKLIETSVRGQEKAVEILSVALQNFQLRLKSPETKLPVIVPLVIGPTGCGKSLLASQVSEIINQPLVYVNCTDLVPGGYVGLTIRKVIKNAYSNHSESEKFLYVFDEFDKLSKSRQHDNGWKSTIQYELLKFFDEKINLRNMFINREFENRSDDNEWLNPKVGFMMFSGAFAGIENIIYTRLFKEFRGNKRLIDEENLIGYVKSDDIITYGIIPELAGRLGYLCPMKPLNESAIVDIMLNSSESDLRKHITACNQLGIEVNFTEKALAKIAREVVARNVGVRSVNVLLTQILHPVYSGQKSSKLWIDEDYLSYIWLVNKYPVIFEMLKCSRIASLFEFLPEDLVLECFIVYEKFNRKSGYTLT